MLGSSRVGVIYACLGHIRDLALRGGWILREFKFLMAYSEEIYRLWRARARARYNGFSPLDSPGYTSSVRCIPKVPSEGGEMTHNVSATSRLNQQLE